MSAVHAEIAPPKRPLYQKILVIAGMTSLVGGTLTGIMTYVNGGVREGFWTDWLSSFAIAVLVMAPAGLLFMTLIEKLIQQMMPNGHKIFRQVITGLLMALFMESILAASTTANLLGFADITTFASAWIHAFIAALPFGLFMALLTSITLKPKLDRFLAN
ncbi:DUF2798 domain-containing protein [Gilvimarinus chinensis]|uniref:DUF2798 domain-containing protein n=1 Tax=Gilvimarinus chinensis TaxID=396005 RepID=UPI000377F094|nr:DUF2798 domain-containing protein [Gilvimarinus chinensis]